MDRSKTVKKVSGLLLLGLLASGALADSARLDDTATVRTTVCEILQDPSRLDGKTVQIRAIVKTAFEVFAVADSERLDCGWIWLSYPGGGPAALLSVSSLTPRVEREPVKLKRDRRFRKFQELVDAEMYPRSRDSLCESCFRYEVTANLTGRLDAAGEGRGFGHLNRYEARLELQSVGDISVVDLSSRYDQTLFSATPIELPSGRLRGKVVGDGGVAVADAEVTLRTTEADPPSYRDLTEWTDEKGQFKFDDVPPGRYLAGVNLEEPPSGTVPYQATYFPGTLERIEAVAIEVQDGQRRHITIRLGRALERLVIPVKVSWPDGKPVAHANVWLKEVRNPIPVVGGSVSHTDSNGLFDLVGLRGIDYVVGASIYLQPLYTPYCSEKVLWQSGTQASSRVSLILTREGDVCRGE